MSSRGVHSDAWFGRPKIQVPGALQHPEHLGNRGCHIGKVFDHLEADNCVETLVSDGQRESVPEKRSDTPGPLCQ